MEQKTPRPSESLDRREFMKGVGAGAASDEYVHRHGSVVTPRVTAQTRL
jgi:hypothetical protein